MCKIFGVSTSGYYAYVDRINQGETKKEAFNRYVDERILFHFYDNHGCYGSPRIFRKLRDVDQIIISEKTVTNRMAQMKLYATPPRRFQNTTDSMHMQRVFPNELNRSFEPQAPNTAWVTDITYVHTGEGFLYLNPIMDLFSRKIISYKVADYMRGELSLGALKTALTLRQPKKGLVHHSDRGAQYCSRDYVGLLNKYEAKISMSRKGNPYDNACMESFFASLKKEFLHKYVFMSKGEAMVAIDRYIKFYNEKRMHSSLDYMSPNEKELSYKMSRSLGLN